MAKAICGNTSHHKIVINYPAVRERMDFADTLHHTGIVEISITALNGTEWTYTLPHEQPHFAHDLACNVWSLGPVQHAWLQERTGEAQLNAFFQACGLPSHARQRPMAGYLCEACLDASATMFASAPWGGEMALCAQCHGKERK